jgi:hypothetical protein
MVVSRNHRTELYDVVSLNNISSLPYSEDNCTPVNVGLESNVRLCQARIGFPHRILLQRILDETTGNGLSKGAGIRHARITMITTLANHEKPRSNHTSKNTIKRRYKDGEA